MTDMAAADLRLQLDAMRAARAEDAKACARLTARVKELEAEVARLKPLLREARPGDRCTGRTSVDIRERIDEVMSPGIAKETREVFAEGTRDEKAARCARCGVAVSGRFDFCQACAVGVGAP